LASSDNERVTIRTDVAAVLFALWAIYLALSGRANSAFYAFLASTIFFLFSMFIVTAVRRRKEQSADALRKP
jgi:Co/Zn/Cd efflux system component